MTKRLLVLLLGCLALTLVAAGCGGGDDNGGGGGGGGNSAGGGTSGGGGNGGGAQAPAATGGSGKVSMKDIKFNPGTVKISAGDTVTWTNDDSVGHDVTGDGFKSGDAGGIGPGGTYKHKFAKAGTFKYQCTVHPGMTGEVDVK
jgi:plastocyanin